MGIRRRERRQHATALGQLRVLATVNGDLSARKPHSICRDWLAVQSEDALGLSR